MTMSLSEHWVYFDRAGRPSGGIQDNDGSVDYLWTAPEEAFMLEWNCLKLNIGSWFAANQF